MVLGEAPEDGSILTFIGQGCGILYSTAWALCFYPQIWKNYKRQSVAGLSIEMIVLSTIGFTFYFSYVGITYGIQLVRGYPSIVPFSDVFFGFNCLFCLLLQCYQCAFYERGTQTIGWYGFIMISVLFLGAMFCLGLAIDGDMPWTIFDNWPLDGSSIDHENPPPISPSNFLSNLAYLKMLVNITAYAPQAWENWMNKSAEGIELAQYWLDFAGGSLSLLELILTCIAHNDWTYVTGNLAKPGVALLSILYDVIFLLQGHVFYPQKEGKKANKKVAEESIENQESGSSLDAPLVAQ